MAAKIGSGIGVADRQKYRFTADSPAIRKLITLGAKIVAVDAHTPRKAMKGTI